MVVEGAASRLAAVDILFICGSPYKGDMGGLAAHVLYRLFRGGLGLNRRPTTLHDIGAVLCPSPSYGALSYAETLSFAGAKTSTRFLEGLIFRRSSSRYSRKSLPWNLKALYTPPECFTQSVRWNAPSVARN